MAEIIVNASTSAVLIDTSLLTPAHPNAIVLLSSVQNPGQTVTIRDSIGYLSTPNSIVVSTTAGVLFADGTSSVTITQRFGYLSVTSRDAASWTLTNSFGFPQNLTVANVNSLSTGSITTSTLTASDYVSTPFVKATTIVADTMECSQLGTVSTLIVGAPFTSQPGFAANVNGGLNVTNDLTIAGVLTVFGDISASALNVGGLFSTLGSAFIGNDLNVGGNISAPNAVITASSLTITGPANFYSLDVSDSITASSALLQGSVRASTIETGTIKINGDSIYLSSQTITTNGTSFTFSGGIRGPAFSTGSISTSALTTSNLTVGTTIQAPSLLLMQLGAANIVNPAGSLSINSIGASTLRASSVTTSSIVTQSMQASTLNFTGNLIIPATGYLTADTVLCSSLNTRAFYASTIAATTFEVDEISVNNLSLSGTFTGTTLAELTIPNADVTAASITTSSLRATTVSAATLALSSGAIETGADFYITAETVNMRNVQASTATVGAFSTSTLTATNLTIGTPVDPAVRGPYFIVTSSTNCVISGGPGDYYAPFFLSNVKPAGYTSNTPYIAQATFRYVIPNGGYLVGNLVNLQNSLFWANELDCESVVKYLLSPPSSYFEAIHMYGYFAQDQTSNASPIFQSTFNTAADWVWTATMINDSVATLTMQSQSNVSFSLVDPNTFINMQNGVLKWNYAMNATTIQNSLNDIATRNLLYYGSLNFVSDPRLKEEVEPADLRRCYDTIRDIPLRRYAFKDVYMDTFHVTDRHRLGILADEYEVHFPKSVVEREAPIPGYSTIKTVDTQQLEMAHLGATQYLLEEVAELRSTLDGLLL